MRIAVIGLGLIGGSLTRALAAAGHDVFGYDADPATRGVARTAAGQAKASERWQVTASVREAAEDAHMAIIAVPLPAVAEVIDELANAGFHGLITDVTSVKGQVRDIVADRWRRSGTALAGFVGGHPMTGREAAGFAASDPGLFRGRAWALCLEPQITGLDDFLEVTALATSLGARVVPTTADEHDRAVAIVSHVPHLLAAALMRTATADPLALSLGAGSFHDGTRVAASPPDLMAAICGGNADAVDDALTTVVEHLRQAAIALDTKDPIGELRPWFAPASAARNSWPPAPSDPVDIPAQTEVLLRLGRAGGWITDVATDRRSVTAVRPHEK
jgi:prephenate dehydrogenase